MFDDPNLVSSAGLVPVMKIATDAGLQELADRHLSVPTDKGANAGPKVTSLVAGMVAGADSIDDMALLRHGGMRKIFNRIYAPSTLGSFLRTFTFGHVRQLDAVAWRFLARLADSTPLLGDPAADESMVFLDVDDTIIEVHGHAKQGAGFGYSGVRGLNALLATVSAGSFAPVIIGQRLRKGSTGSPRGAKRLVADALATISRTHLTGRRVLVRADSAFYGYATVSAALKAGADVSVTARMDPAIKRAIASIAQDAWTPIQYTNAILDEQTGTWISTAEVAEIEFAAFSSRKKSEQITGRLVVRRIPDLAPTAAPGQGTLFDHFRFHAFFTTTDPAILDTVSADKTHRQHAVIEQVHADLKNGPLAHLPSGVFTANAAWLILAVLAFNLTRAAGTICGNQHARATAGTIRRRLINIAARTASSARKLRLHLPTDWPWEEAWNRLFERALGPPAPTLS